MKLLVLALLASVLPTLSLAGPKVGNGGDPRVVEFLSAAKEICQWMGRDGVLKTYETACFQEWNDLSASVNLKTRKARIRSTFESVRDQNGVEKDAVTDSQTRKILIGAKLWNTDSEQQKRMTAAMEMSLLLGIPGRYEHAQRFLQTAEAAKSPSQTTDPCTTAREAMSSLVESYISAIKLCYSLETSNKTASEDYEDEVRLARQMETLFAEAMPLCQSACGNPRVCHDRPLKGACRGGH